MDKRIICQRCKSYYVTWEKNKPHGCRAYGFKSQALPAIVVKQSSGVECSFYEPKNKNL
jgi:hypothetical protein